VPSSNFRSVMVVILGAIFLAGFFFAGYHIAIQQHLVAMPAFCGSPEPDVITAIMQPIASAPMPGCDQVTASFMGFSLAYYNAALSLLLALICWIWAFGSNNGKTKKRIKK
jgi:disulfide bond formation protein DsbB